MVAAAANAAAARSISEGNIEIKQTEYSLKQTDNKRELVFEGNKLVNTSSSLVVFD